MVMELFILVLIYAMFRATWNGFIHSHDHRRYY